MASRLGKPSHQQAIPRDALWKTISTLDETTMRNVLFHCTAGTLTHQQMLFQIFDLHHARLRKDDERAEAARKAEAARLKRKQTKVVDFDHHFRQIDWWLQNDPVDRKACRMVWNLYENKIKPRIFKIRDKASSPDTNFGTRCNGLETLRLIAESVCANAGGAIGANMVSLFGHGDLIEAVMLDILKAMSAEERRRMAHLTLEGVEWWKLLVGLARRGETDRSDAVFCDMEEVLNFLIDGDTRKAADQPGVTSEPRGT
ncbi:hypothetical protein BDV95DRAFT_593700 [Massariosphaeria phaeospora]|uniref:Uncharacterized protein n=1 Tax=Massariosphaeria phaeospora TaxID=100035 RepID=A0A7C8M9L7_9PLEO|nr:hypothetical protein BDV95DRAFT_593700 [Massariosphaeria phaeospora]